MPVTPEPTKENADIEAAFVKEWSSEELRDFKQVTNGLIQDAINLWDELWAELDGTNQPGALVKLEAGFEPSCGWSEYLRKMWTLRHTLSFAKKYSRQGPDTVEGIE